VSRKSGAIQLVVGGIYYRMQVSHLKLCASRSFWLVACPSQGHEMLFDAHTRSFAALGGVARRGIYDNMRTAVDKVHKGSRPSLRRLPPLAHDSNRPARTPRSRSGSHSRGGWPRRPWPWRPRGSIGAVAHFYFGADTHL
jgi:hypothetical protein